MPHPALPPEYEFHRQRSIVKFNARRQLTKKARCCSFEASTDECEGERERSYSNVKGVLFTCCTEYLPSYRQTVRRRVQEGCGIKGSTSTSLYAVKPNTRRSTAPCFRSDRHGHFDIPVGAQANEHNIHRRLEKLDEEDPRRMASLSSNNPLCDV